MYIKILEVLIDGQTVQKNDTVHSSSININNTTTNTNNIKSNDNK